LSAYAGNPTKSKAATSLIIAAFIAGWPFDG
jgi:hypothetical protein